MGIPHLITHLRPYATSVDLASHNAVIDGPGLAYHTWHICLSSQPKFRNPYEATPSYRLLGETVIRWLDELQAHNICLKKIFFDGSLPTSKRPTRIDRLIRYTKQINDYHQAWPQIIPSMYTDNTSQRPPAKLFEREALSSNFTKLPAAPFLVPAIIETLSRCKRYEDVVEVVPGEADLFCAEYVKAHGGVVFTGDSDLLLHQLGDGAVSFFRDISPTVSGDKTSLTCIQYQVRVIAQRLGLPENHGLCAIGFEMTMDAFLSFPDLLRKAMTLHSVSLNDSMYQEFASEYKSIQDCKWSEKACSNGNVHSPSVRHQIKMLDPRISEFLLQFSKIAQAVGVLVPHPSHHVDFPGQVDIFLPFLLDCPRRTSAWEMSTSVRQLAYGLVNIVLPPEEKVLKVTEYRRIQNGSRGREWQVPGARELPKACAQLSEQFKKLQSEMSGLPQQWIWRALAIYQDQEFSLGIEKSALSDIVAEQSRNGKASQFRLTWDYIHLFAQFQGSYYSFRILKQIIGIVLRCDDTKNVPLALHELCVELESLPTLEELPTIIEFIHEIGSPEDQATWEIVWKLLSIQHGDELVKAPVKDDKKRRKMADASEGLKGQSKSKSQGKPQREKSKQRKRPNNIFELLNTE